MDHSAHPALHISNDGVIDLAATLPSTSSTPTPDKVCFQIQTTLRGVDLQMIAEILPNIVIIVKTR